MNLRNRKMSKDVATDPSIDALFRQALDSFADAAPSEDVWDNIVGDIQAAPQRRWIPRWLARSSWPRRLDVGRWGSLRWGRLVSWIHGFQMGYPPLPSRPYCVGPNGRTIQAPFAGIMVKQVLDLRLAS
jgi:hypothetical protein